MTILDSVFELKCFDWNKVYRLLPLTGTFRLGCGRYIIKEILTLTGFASNLLTAKKRTGFSSPPWKKYWSHFCVLLCFSKHLVKVVMQSQAFFRRFLSDFFWTFILKKLKAKKTQAKKTQANFSKKPKQKIRKLNTISPTK